MAHAASVGDLAGGGKGSSRKPVASTRFLHSGRPIQMVCERIWRDWLRGVPERSLSIMYERKREAIEEILRDQAQAMARMARSSAAGVACALIALVAIDAWQAAASGDTAAVTRAFRSRRGSRRRGLEDGGGEAIEHARLEWRTGMVWKGSL